MILISPEGRLMNRPLRTIVSILVLLLLSAPLAAEESSSALAKESAAELRDAGRELHLETARLSTAISQARPLTVTEALRRVGPSRTPGDIFRWIRDEIAFEPYSGSLRGPEGALTARSANAVDQSLLAAAMLQEAGYPHRFVTGRLAARDAEAILDHAIGDARLYDSLSGDLRPFSDLGGTPRNVYVQSIQDHIWLEVEFRDDFRPFDLIAAPIFGMTPAAAAERHQRLPASFQTTMEITLVSHLSDGQTHENITVEGPLPRFAYRTLALSFEDDPTRHRGLIPLLTVADQTAQGEPLSAASLNELELRFRIRIGERENRWRQSLFRHDQGVNIFDFDHQHFSLAIIPGWTSGDQLRKLSGTAAKEALSALNTWIDAEAAEELSSSQRRLKSNAVLNGLGATFGYAFTHQLDQLTLDLARRFGILPVLARPRVITTALLRRGEHFSLDLRLDGDQIEALPLNGIPSMAAPALLSIHGQNRERLVGEMISTYGSEEIFTMEELFRQASRESIRFTTVEARTMDHLDLVDVSPRTREEIRRQIQRQGVFILTPLRNLEARGAQHLGWWSLDPISGDLRAHRDQALLTAPASQPQASASSAELLMAHLRLIARHYSASHHASGDDHRFAPLVCRSRTQLLRLAGAFCATSTPIPLENLDRCLDAPPEPGGDLLSMGRVSCVDQVAAIRCSSAFAAAILRGELVVSSEATPQSQSAPLCR